MKDLRDLKDFDDTRCNTCKRRQGRLVVIATPVGALTGMDHYKAAYEAAFRYSFFFFITLEPRVE
jgi:hypothetical protein